MNREDFSLFTPQGVNATYKTLSKEALNDLSVDYICEALTKDPYELNIIKGFLSTITDNEEVIKYRRDIFEDFLNFPNLRDDLTALILKLKDLREIERFQKDTEASSLWQLINRLRELDGYVDCITAIKKTLEETDVKSAGLLKLKEMVQSIYRDNGFTELKADITEMFSMVRDIKSITLGVNLDSLLRPKTVGVISINDKAFTDSGLLKKFMNFASNQSELNHGTEVSTFTHFHPANPSTVSFGLGTSVTGAQNDLNHFENSSLTGADPMSDALKKVVTDILKRTVNNLKSTLNKYVGNSGYTFITLMPEITFYIRFSELCDKIIAKGFTLSKADILNKSDRLTTAKGIYNIKLAIKSLQGEECTEAKDIITNDFKFDSSARIYILTGPNRGGKTTITQAVGLAFLLAQNGIYVPANEMSISPADNIFTHFPADENDTVDLGRLGEESKRLSEIFTSATKGSLLLLNESLATTNVSEGLYIAKDVIKAMRYLGVRSIFNTHMHDLARNLEEINSTIEGDSKIESMVTGVENGKRSFKIFIAPPQGVSYAKDIAVKYGVTFEKIKEEIDLRKA
ncbi:MAG: DNA mismatch repair protein [Clostridia bacterium]|nr:DNA mismatch repair protein [Clostridia bacterium]